MSNDDETQLPTAPSAPKPKRKLTEKQRAVLAKGQAKLRERHAARAAARAATPPPASPPSEPVMLAGARLVPVERDEEEEEQDDVARVLARRDRSNGHSNGNGHAHHIPDIADIADQTEFYSGSDSTPPLDSNRSFRDRPSVDVPDFAGDTSAPRGLDDLMSMAPLGDGQYYILVDRKQPKTWEGTSCAGVQPRIRTAMDQDDFINTYGGGQYTLTLFGPPKRGGIIDPITRSVRPKALTAPIAYSVPLSMSPPILFLAEDGDEDMMPARPGSAFGRRPATNADAKILETEYTHQERMEDRREQREQSERAREAELAREAEEKGLSMAQLLVERERADAERRERMHERELKREREIAAERARDAQRPGTETQFAKAMVDMIAVLNPNKGGPTSDQLQHLTDSHRRDMESARAVHSAELKAANDRLSQNERNSEDRVKYANERADERVREEKQRAEQRVKEVEERSERRIREVEEAKRREIEDVQKNANQRLDDERRNHQRDLESQKSAFEMRQESLKNSYDMRLSTKEDEISRLRADSSRWQSEAGKNKDIVGRVREFKETAGALGLVEAGTSSEPEGPTDLKGMAFVLVQQAIANAPAFIEKAGAAVRAARESASPQQVQQAAQAQHEQMVRDSQNTHPSRNIPPRLRGRDGTQFVSQPVQFATEEDAPGIAVPQVIHYPAGYSDLQGGGQQHQQQQLPLPNLQVQPQPMGPPMHPPPPPPGPQQQHVPQQPAPAPPPQQAVSSAPPITPEEIHGARPFIEQALASGKSAAEFAAQFGASMPRDRLIATLQTMSPDRIVAIIGSTPEGQNSPLVRREGQKFVRELWKHLAQQVSA